MLAHPAPATEPTSSSPWRWLPVSGRARWLDPRRIACLLIALLVLAPVLHVLTRAAEAGRNVVYWDEIDTSLALLLRLDEGVSTPEFFRELLAVNNEHRMATSRLLFAASYWLTGTINFAVIALIGNAFIVAFCLLVVHHAGTAPRRLWLAVLLAFLVYHLGHYENFLWSGASIDHFQIVLLAGVCVIGLARGTPAGVIIGGVFALLATFTLAHGIVLWPVGATLLGAARRWRHLTGWGVLSVAVIGSYLPGFELNAAHQFAGWSPDGMIHIGWYWLMLAGSALALGNDTAGALLGAALIAAFAWQAWRRAATREPVAFGLAAYALGALALIAVGRATETGGIVHSRYLVLSAVAWAFSVFMFLERYVPPARFWRSLACLLPIMAAFNLTANHVFASRFEAWIECRDSAAVRYEQHGADGRGLFKLHPAPDHATRLLDEAERRGVFRMGPVCLPRTFRQAEPSGRIAYFVDELTVSPRSAFVGGWAAIPGRTSRRGELHVVLRSDAGMHVFTSVTMGRPDVAAATNEPGWELSGFRFAARRERLPAGEFQVGFLITENGRAEYIMTAHRLRLVGEGEALLATDN